MADTALALSIGLGLRAKELASVRWSDVFDADGHVRRVVHLKAAYMKGARTRDVLPVMLHELVAHRWHDPGITKFRKRVGCSQCLDRSHQGAGIPASWCGIASAPKPMPGMFRSTFDDGVFDVRKLYGKQFCDWINGATTDSAATAEDDIEEILGRLLI